MSGRRTISAVIPAAPDSVRAFYVDLDNLRTLHPLIVAVERTARTVGPDGHVTHYRVRDRVPFGRITFPVTYTATLHVPSTGDVTTEARQFPGVRLCGRVSFEEIEDGTRLTERIDISAPWPLAGFTARQAVAAHTAMLAGIRNYFSVTPP